MEGRGVGEFSEANCLRSKAKAYGVVAIVDVGGGETVSPSASFSPLPSVPDAATGDAAIAEGMERREKMSWGGEGRGWGNVNF